MLRMGEPDHAPLHHHPPSRMVLVLDLGSGRRSYRARLLPLGC